MQPELQLREHHRQSLTVEVLRKAGQVLMAARGYSMLPSLWPGDVLTIRAQTMNSTRVGDIVLFARAGRFFVHRVVRVSLAGGEFITRGDGMLEDDGILRSEELLGTVTSVTRFGEQVPLRACSLARRLVGLALAYSDRLRSLALRAHTWQAHANSD